MEPFRIRGNFPSRIAAVSPAVPHQQRRRLTPGFSLIQGVQGLATRGDDAVTKQAPRKINVAGVHRAGEGKAAWHHTHNGVVLVVQLHTSYQRRRVAAVVTPPKPIVQYCDARLIHSLSTIGRLDSTTKESRHTKERLGVLCKVNRLTSSGSSSPVISMLRLVKPSKPSIDLARLRSGIGIRHCEPSILLRPLLVDQYRVHDSIRAGIGEGWIKTA